MPTFCHRTTPAPDRRTALATAANGFGLLALGGLFGNRAVAAPHFAPKAKRVIFLFMHGGPSQVDTFDPKPLLTRHHGKPFPGEKPRVQFAATGNLLKSPWKFAPGGQSGLQVSDLFPEVRKRADDLCVIRSVHADNSAHGGAVLQLHTGSDTFVRPSMGAWVNYGLGAENANLPGFVTVSPTVGHGGVGNYASGFLPAEFQGTAVGQAGLPVKGAGVQNLKPAAPASRQRAQLDLLAQMQADRPDPALDARIRSFELAFRMQAEAPKVFDLSGETKETLDLYGVGREPTDDFGRQCLLARRFAERGTRFVQVSHSYKWDQHGGLAKDHAKNAAEVDVPIAGLLKDLRRRGLLDDTLVWWGGEFGRTPTAQGGDGRDHNPHGWSMWLAGGGVRAGTVVGATDDFGYYAVRNRVHLHDLHATILHLLGLDHEKLTFRHAGRDFRLTDVGGRVVPEVVA